MFSDWHEDLKSLELSHNPFIYLVCVSITSTQNQKFGEGSSYLFQLLDIKCQNKFYSKPVGKHNLNKKKIIMSVTMIS